MCYIQFWIILSYDQFIAICLQQINMILIKMMKLSIVVSISVLNNIYVNIKNLKSYLFIFTSFILQLFEHVKKMYLPIICKLIIF